MVPGYVPHSSSGRVKIEQKAPGTLTQEFRIEPMLEAPASDVIISVTGKPADLSPREISKPRAEFLHGFETFRATEFGVSPDEILISTPSLNYRKPYRGGVSRSLLRNGF